MTSITRRDFIKGTGVGVVTYSLSHSLSILSKSQAVKTKPNVLLIMADQLRNDAIGACGNPSIQTPHIDSLARGGVLFNNCHSQCPVCMPARATIFTGRYPIAHGVWSNGVPLPDDEITLAHLFAENGYRTGGAGKFHFLPHYNLRKSLLPAMETHPEPFYGFQEFHIGEDGRRGEHYLWIEKNFPDFVGKPDNEIPVELHNSYWAASHTIDFISNTVKKNQPFFAFCSFVDPHHSYNPPSPYGEMYLEADMPPPVRKINELNDKPPFFQEEANSFSRENEKVAYNRTQYYGEVTLIDDSIGRILHALNDLNIRKNTIIVFISDHGDLLGDHWLYHKGPFHYTGCTNVPLIINWMGHLQKGKVVCGMVQQTDIFPTVTELAGIANSPGIQGKSQVEVLTTISENTHYEYAYIESTSSGELDESVDWEAWKGKPQRFGPDPYTIRSQKWRLSYYPRHEFGELYDLESDPDEFINLWNDKKYEKEKSKLKELLLNRIIVSRDPLPKRINYY